MISPTRGARRRVRRCRRRGCGRRSSSRPARAAPRSPPAARVHAEERIVDAFSACCSCCAGTAGSRQRRESGRGGPAPRGPSRSRRRAAKPGLRRETRGGSAVAGEAELPLDLARRGRDGVLLLVGADEVEHGLLLSVSILLTPEQYRTKAQVSVFGKQPPRAPVLGHTAQVSSTPSPAPSQPGQSTRRALPSRPSAGRVLDRTRSASAPAPVAPAPGRPVGDRSLLDSRSRCIDTSTTLATAPGAKQIHPPRQPSPTQEAMTNTCS